jgi:5-oxopent-3-ene-1,2,5-tricarboxylate decarboxylase/2-hydroxyhepta-2,4-diene-1,7-dioate isomerase
LAIAWARTLAMPQPRRIDVDPANGNVHIDGHGFDIGAVDWDVPTRGTVFGTLLNYRGAITALGDAVLAVPYEAPPRAPVLYIKPANTWRAWGTTVALPPSVETVEIGAALGIVIGATACRVREEEAFDCIAGYTIVNDVCEPHASLHRPAIRQRCRDGFCPIGPWVIAKHEVASPDALRLRVLVNGALAAENTTANLIRPIARLVADVTEFMTLSAGDLLLAGVPENAARAGAGDRVRIEIEGVGALENSFAADNRP